MAGARTCPECGSKTDEPVCAVDGFSTVLFDEPDDDSHDPLVGQDFEGRFRVTGLLGRGGYGAVYRATQLGIGRDIALKLLHAKVGKNLKEIARFQQEARALAALKHPHIVDVYDFGQAADGTIYMVMEFLRGQTLEDILKMDGPLSGEEIIGVALHIADALSEAHHAGIIHRDLKPANIFLATGSRGRTTAKVLDFGIARVSGEASAGITLTRVGAIIGSPPYMSPEQSKGDAITPASDLYSLGCILYECLTGIRAFERESATACLVAHCMEPPRPLERGGVPLSGPIVDLTLKLLAKSPTDRPASADEVSAALAAMGPFPLDDEAMLPVGRQRLIFASGSTGPLSGMGMQNADTLADTAADGLSPVVFGARRAAPRRSRGLLWAALLILLLGGGVAAMMALEPWAKSEPTGAVAEAATTDEAPTATEPVTHAASLAATAPSDDLKGTATADDAAAKPEAGDAARQDQAAPVTATPAAVDAPPVPAAVRRLRVRLEATPQAQAKLGDSELGLTPVDLTWEEGESPRVELSARGHRTLEVTLSDDDAATGVRHVRLQRVTKTSPTPGRDETKQPSVTGPSW